MINVSVLSEAEVVGKYFGGDLVISIVSPGRDHPKILGTNIHKFHFHDPINTFTMPDSRLIETVNETIIESIVEIAMDNRYCNRWVIHCEAGVSRSPAIAIGLARFISLSPNRKTLKSLYPLYSKHVCELVEKETSRKIEEIVKELGPGCVDIKVFKKD